MEIRMNLDLIRAWKDEDYRAGLSAEELERLPQNPAGLVELSDSDLDEVNGASYGDTYGYVCSRCVPPPTYTRVPSTY